MTVPSESFTFCNVRSVNPPCSNSLSGYRSGILPTSSRRPAGHHPPQSIPFFSATSRAARSTPVCPPEIIFKCLSACSIAGRNNVRALDYQDHSSFRRTCAMTHAFGHDEVLIDVFVFMPVIFAFKHRHLTTESFTLQSVWLYHLSAQASASF